MKYVMPWESQSSSSANVKPAETTSVVRCVHLTHTAACRYVF